MNTPTILGMFSLLFWSTTIALTRDMTESFGVLPAATYTYLLSGILSCMYYSVKSRGYIGRLIRMPLDYLLICGFLFVSYTLCLYLSVGLAANRQQAIEVGVVNYLWPSSILVFSVPILGKKAKLSLVPGIFLALAGISLASFYGKGFSIGLFKENFSANFMPYFVAFLGAVAWGLYSNFISKLAEKLEGNAVPLFCIVSGIIFGAISLLFPSPSHLSASTALKLAYTVIFPCTLGYVFWDVAMRKGRIILIASLSYLTPVVSTLISCAYLKVSLNMSILAACVLVTAGAIICKYSVPDE